MKINVKTSQKRQALDITADVQKVLASQQSGLCTITALHTTVAVTMAEGNADTNQDLLSFLEAVMPVGVQWQHAGAEHASDHILAAIIGPSVSVPVENGQLALGTWQRLVLVELDGPKQRTLSIVQN